MWNHAIDKSCSEVDIKDGNKKDDMNEESCSYNKPNSHTELSQIYKPQRIKIPGPGRSIIPDAERIQIPDTEQMVMASIPTSFRVTTEFFIDLLLLLLLLIQLRWPS